MSDVKIFCHLFGIQSNAYTFVVIIVAPINIESNIFDKQHIQTLSLYLLY